MTFEELQETWTGTPTELLLYVVLNGVVLGDDLLLEVDQTPLPFSQDAINTNMPIVDVVDAFRSGE